MTRQRVPNIELGSDAARVNLLTNGGFEIWQRGNGPFTASVRTSDMWVWSPVGTDAISIIRDSANADLVNGSAYCAVCTFTLGTGAGQSYVFQQLQLTTENQLHGRTITLSARVRTSTANAVRLGINNYYGSTSHFTYGTFHSGSGQYETLSVTVTMDVTATYCQPGIFFAASCTAYLDNAMLVIGSVPADFVPMHPADDLARCLRYYQRWEPAQSAYAITPGHATAATNAFLYLTMRAPMAITPTFTQSGSWSLINAAYNASLPCTALTLSTATTNIAILTGTVASGLTQGQWTGLFPTGTWISLEANP